MAVFQKSMEPSEIVTAMVNKNLSKAYDSLGTNTYQSQALDYSDSDNVSPNPKKKKKRPNFPDFKANYKNGHPSIVTEWELVCDRYKNLNNYKRNLDNLETFCLEKGKSA